MMSLLNYAVSAVRSHFFKRSEPDTTYVGQHVRLTAQSARADGPRHRYIFPTASELPTLNPT